RRCARTRRLLQGAGHGTEPVDHRLSVTGANTTFRSYPRGAGDVQPAPRGACRLRLGGQVEAEGVGRLLPVGEHDRLVVEVDHPAVVRGHVLLELGRVEVARFIAERLGDLVVVELERARAVDADPRGQVSYLDVVLLRQDLGNDGPDLVVHQREPGLARGRV